MCGSPPIYFVTDGLVDSDCGSHSNTEHQPVPKVSVTTLAIIQ